MGFSIVILLLLLLPFRGLFVLGIDIESEHILTVCDTDNILHTRKDEPIPNCSSLLPPPPPDGFFSHLKTVRQFDSGCAELDAKDLTTVTKRSLKRWQVASLPSSGSPMQSKPKWRIFWTSSWPVLKTRAVSAPLTNRGTIVSSSQFSFYWQWNNWNGLFSGACALWTICWCALYITLH